MSDADAGMDEIETDDLKDLLATAVDRLNPCAKKSDLDRCAQAYERFKGAEETTPVRINIEVDGLAFVMLASFLDELKRREAFAPSGDVK